MLVVVNQKAIYFFEVFFACLSFFIIIPLSRSAFRHIRRYAHVSPLFRRCILQFFSLSFLPRLFRFPLQF